MAPKITLQNSKTSCVIHPDRGALVSSLKIAGRELLWMPPDFSEESSSWPGGGLPLCFPFAGRVWHNGVLYQYDLNGKLHHMPLHGFSFASKWSVSQQSADTLILSLQDNDASRVLYPFSFHTQLTLKLTETGLRTDIRVTHNNSSSKNEDMPIAIGWHPYFRVQAPSDETLEVPADSYYVVTPEGRAGKLAPTTELGASPLSIAHPLLKSLILTHLKANDAVLHNKREAAKIQLKFGPQNTYQHVVLWTNRSDEFYCVEPWMSLPDAVATKTGCRWLKPGDSLDAWFSIEYA